MPCDDGGWGKDLEIQKAITESSTMLEGGFAVERKRLHMFLDRYAQMLCYMVGEARENGTFDELPDNIKKWSETHAGIDYRRMVDTVDDDWENNPDSTPEDLTAAHIRKTEEIHPVSRYHKKWFLKMYTERDPSQQ